MSIDIVLARQRVPIYAASGRLLALGGKSDLVWYSESGMIAKMVRRKDGKVSRCYLRAAKHEIVRIPTGWQTVVRVLPMTWKHKMSAV